MTEPQTPTGSDFLAEMFTDDADREVAARVVCAIESEAREQVLDVDKLAKALDPVMNCDGTLDDAIALFLAAYEEATDD